MSAPKLTKKGGGRRGGTGLGCLSGLYGAGVLFTIVWYAVATFDGCDARTLRGRCIDFDIFEILFYALIWPLHWLLEPIEAVAG